jgi:hypothetical protein
VVIDECAAGGATNSDEERFIEAVGERGESGVCDGVTVGEDEEGGGAVGEIRGEFRGLVEAFEEVRFSGFEEDVEGEFGGHVTNHISVGGVLNEGFWFRVKSDEGEFDVIAGAAVEDFGEDLGGPFCARLGAGFAGVSDEHTGRDVEEDDQVTFAGLGLSVLG